MLQKVHAVHGVLFHRLQITYATNPGIDMYIVLYLYAYIYILYT